MLNIIILLYALLGKPNSCQKELSTCSIQLVSIDCIKQEDDTGNDQVYLTLNGKEITSKYRTGSRGTISGHIDLKGIEPQPISEKAMLTLWEYDLLDPDDKLGSVSVRCSLPGAYSETITYRNPFGSADYVLHYVVY
jgi:hypothetical protein